MAFNNVTTLSDIKLKYLKKSNIPKQVTHVKIKIIFLIIIFCWQAISFAEKKEMMVVIKINTTYLGFQLI